MTTNFSVSLSVYDTKNARHLYFKSDGRRFDEERTIKLSCDVKYDITISIKPAGEENLILQKLIMGGDTITPDKKVDHPDRTEYSLVWFTNGYQPTRKAARLDLRIVFKFAVGELVVPLQVKFYPFTESTHVVWGTTLKSIELESVGNFQPGASPNQRFPTKKMSYR